MNIFKHFLKPEHIILYGSTGFIALSFILYYIIDLKNYWGARDWLFNTEGVYFYFTYTPFFFQHYGRDGGFAEIVQWSLLAVAISLALFYAGKLFDLNRSVAKFWLLFGLGMMLMLLEDAGEIRHQFMSYVQWAAGEPDQGLYGTLFEGIFFLIVGGLPVYAFIRYRDEMYTHGKVFWFVCAGIVTHAIAASLSFIGTAFQMTLDTDVYSVMGDWFKIVSLRLADPEVAVLWNAWDAGNWLYQVDFYLMDSFVEENIEIIGNAFFLAAAVSVFTVYVKGIKSVG